MPPPARSRPALLRPRPLVTAMAVLALAVATWPPVPFALAAVASPPEPFLAGAPPRPAGGDRVPALRLPVDGPVVRGFEPPSGPYGPGHRGVDLAARLGTPVAAPAGGRVVFAGRVAGLGWVSLGVAPGVVVTVGPLDRPAVSAGRTVPTLARLGRLAPGHGGRLHLGLRLGGAYVDPLPYLVGDGPPRLAPLPLPGPAAG